MRQFLLVSWLAGLLFVLPKATANSADKLIDVPATELGSKYQLVGKLKIPLGTMTTIQGIVVEGPFKGFEGGPNLRVQRIDGRATQEDIQIDLGNYVFLNKLVDRRNAKRLQAPLKVGECYEFYGYETGKFIGDPVGLVRVVPVQTIRFSLILEFVAEKGRKIDPIRLGPADFVDREALLEGRTETRRGQSCLVGDDWTLIVDPANPWPANLQNQLVEAYGIIRKTDQPKTFRVEHGTTRPVRLEDQVGSRVELRGEAWESDGQWRFEYRGVRLYVEEMERLVTASGVKHGSAAVVRGILDEAMLPALDQIAAKSEPELKKCFIVRHAMIEPLKRPLLMPERPKTRR